MDHLFDVVGKNVIIAGGASGLGRTLAQAFADRGARCLVADLNEQGAQNVAQSLTGEGHSFCHLDVSKAGSCSQLMEQAVNIGELDVLINSAGIIHLAPALDMESTDFEAVLQINTTGSFLLARAAAKVMRSSNQGRIITIASASSQVANPNYVAYATSKGALVQLTRVLAKEWAQYGITVNAISPAFTLTPMTEKYVSDPDFENSALKYIPMGRFGQATDLIGMAILLATQAGEFITGQTIYVDGGRTLC
jgi:NAD(P)-dependent dehydrogenase (short-subunit alcohol dehydrogenase family)